MSHAENDYIVFVDSDDYIAKDSLEQFAKAIAMDNPDVMWVYGYRFSEKNGIKEVGRFRDDMTGAMTGTDFFSKVLYRNEYSPASVHYIFKRDFIRVVKIRPPVQFFNFNHKKNHLSQLNIIARGCIF